jgi:hypothetical protein
MRITRLSVGGEKRASDGDYGNEMVKAEMFADLEPGEDAYVVLDKLLGMVRLQLERDMTQSPNLKVRRSVIREVRRCNRCQEPLADDDNSYMHALCREAEDAEREARYQEQKQKYERKEEEQRELEDLPL